MFNNIINFFKFQKEKKELLFKFGDLQTNPEFSLFHLKENQKYFEELEKLKIKYNKQ